MLYYSIIYYYVMIYYAISAYIVLHYSTSVYGFASKVVVMGATNRPEARGTAILSCQKYTMYNHVLYVC